MDMSCPICGEPERIDKIVNRDAFEVPCPRCGVYWITRRLLNDFRSPVLDEEIGPLRPYLSAATRQAYEAGSLAKLESDNWRELALAHSRTRIRDKSMKLLRWIASESRHFGDRVHITNGLDYPLVDAASDQELLALNKHLEEAGLIDVDQELEGQDSRLTMKGWELAEPLGTGGAIPNRCFVAMSFDPLLNDAYELGIRAAIVDDCKLPEPIRMDREQHNDNISNRILADIRSAQFLVADFTLQRQGVYFEAGFAMALGRTVIWTCREDHFKNTHFDTQQFNHIIWTDPKDLRSKLKDRILATVLPSK